MKFMGLLRKFFGEKETAKRFKFDWEFDAILIL